MMISFLFSFFSTFASWGRFSFQGDLARSWKMRRKIFFLVILLIVNKHRLIRSRLRRCPLWFKKQRHFYTMHKNQPELSRNTFWSENVNNKKDAKTHNQPDKIVQWYILFPGAFFKYNINYSNFKNDSNLIHPFNSKFFAWIENRGICIYFSCTWGNWDEEVVQSFSKAATS